MFLQIKIFQLLMLNNEMISALFYLSIVNSTWKLLSYCIIVSLFFYRNNQTECLSEYSDMMILRPYCFIGAAQTSSIKYRT